MIAIISFIDSKYFRNMFIYLFYLHLKQWKIYFVTFQRTCEWKWTSTQSTSKTKMAWTTSPSETTSTPLIMVTECHLTWRISSRAARNWVRFFSSLRQFKLLTTCLCKNFRGTFSASLPFQPTSRKDEFLYSPVYFVYFSMIWRVMFLIQLFIKLNFPLETSIQTSVQIQFHK